MEVKIKALCPCSPYSMGDYDNRVGMELLANLDNPILLHPGMRRLIPTGLTIELPPGTEAQIRPKRDLAIDCGVTILDAPHILSEGDDHEIRILLINLGEKGVSIKPGMAIAHMVIVPVYQPLLSFHTGLLEQSDTPLPRYSIPSMSVELLPK